MKQTVKNSCTTLNYCSTYYPPNGLIPPPNTEYSPKKKETENVFYTISPERPEREPKGLLYRDLREKQLIQQPEGSQWDRLIASLYSVTL